jgi:hypothetical protein
VALTADFFACACVVDWVLWARRDIGDRQRPRGSYHGGPGFEIAYGPACSSECEARRDISLALTADSFACVVGWVCTAISFRLTPGPARPLLVNTTTNSNNNHA